MTAYRLTLVARRDVETLVRALARDDVRAAERAVDELCATMEWLAGTPDVGQLRSDLVSDEFAAGGAPRVRLWALRDWLLVYAEPPANPSPEGASDAAPDPPPDPAADQEADAAPEGAPDSWSGAASEGPARAATDPKPCRSTAPTRSPTRGDTEPITVLRVLETQRPRWG